jgi:hypothetical protein
MEPEHISPDNSEDEDAAAMEAFMGFSTFGSHKPPAKKRKFNPSTDAFVEGQELEKLDRGGKKGMGSGGNTMPLGKTRIIGEVVGRGGNDDEIELDMDEEEDREGDGPRYMDTSLPPPAEAGLRGGDGGHVEEEDGPRSIDSSLPAPADGEKERSEDAYVDISEPSPAEATEMQARIDAILARIAPDDEAAENDADAPLDDTIAESSTLPPPPHGLPQRPAFAASSDTEFMQGSSRGRGFSDAASNTSRGGRGRGRGRGGREKGERNEKWYEGYYDPTFNENPWARLEKENGLPSVGTWLENQQRKGDGQGAGVS